MLIVNDYWLDRLERDIDDVFDFLETLATFAKLHQEKLFAVVIPVLLQVVIRQVQDQIACIISVHTLNDLLHALVVACSRFEANEKSLPEFCRNCGDVQIVIPGHSLVSVSRNCVKTGAVDFT